MTIRQKRAISYAVAERARKRREAYIMEREGSLEGFKRSKYKSLHWYIVARYGERVC